MRTAYETFGIGGEDLAAQILDDSNAPGGYGATGPYASTDAQNEPALDVAHALIDPAHSAIFWVGLAAVLGLVLVTGQFKVQAALGGRAGRK